MVNSDMAGQSSADEAAQRAAAEARRREIMEKIRQLEQEQAECQGLKAAFHRMNGSLESIITQVNGLKERKLEADIQRFSGVSAEEVDTGMLNVQTVMGKRNGRFFDVKSAVGSQIVSLDSHIAELGGRIDALRASL